MNAAARRRKKTKKENGARVGSHRHRLREQQAADVAAAAGPNGEAAAQFLAAHGQQLGRSEVAERQAAAAAKKTVVAEMTAKEAIRAQRAAGIVERAEGAQKRQRRQPGKTNVAAKDAPQVQQQQVRADAPQQQRARTAARAAHARMGGWPGTKCRCPSATACGTPRCVHMCRRNRRERSATTKLQRSVLNTHAQGVAGRRLA